MNWMLAWIVYPQIIALVCGTLITLGVLSIMKRFAVCLYPHRATVQQTVGFDRESNEQHFARVFSDLANRKG